MPIINRMAELHGDITAWRQDFHRNPELLYDVHETAATIAEKLRDFGCDEVVEGIGRTGVVGVIHGKTDGNGAAIGLRADMDALPLHEESGKPWSSQNAGKMHACGHDGHSAMLLGAARYLAETRNFSGSAVMIFQPAEEGGAGGKAMVNDGLMERFGIDEVYGLHNKPGLPVGQFAIRSGALLASTDEFLVGFTGKGTHAAMPNLGSDPLVAAAHCVSALQTIVSRNADPIDSLVVSVTQFHAGSSHNIIPETAKIHGTVRCLNDETRKLAEQRLREIVEHVAKGFGVSVKVDYRRGYPVTHNHPAQTEKATHVASEIAGAPLVDSNAAPIMGGEDFSYMLEERPGAFIFLGNGDTAGLHNPRYDFNDEAIPYGCSYFAKLIETLMPAHRS